jgi:hypothetical protein
MDWKRILLFAAILIIVVVFYQQIRFGCKSNKIEGLTSSEKGSSEKSENPDAPLVCADANYGDPKNLPLREYYIKSSFNSAYDGNSVSAESIVARLAEGYRFIDLNVFCASGQQVFVGYSPGNTPDLAHGGLLLSEALDAIAKNAFIKPTTPPSGSAPVSWDYTKSPMIVNIRVFRGVGSTVDVVGNVAKVINPDVGVQGQSSGGTMASSKYYVNSPGSPVLINGCTPLDNIAGKILFTMNIENILQVYTPSGEFAKNVPDQTVAAMNTFVNFLSGGSTCVAFYSYTDPSLTSRTNTLNKTSDDLNSYQTNIQYMSLAFPHPTDALTQPDIRKFALNCSVLILPMRVYVGSDPNLVLNTKIFDQYSKPGGFVPASSLRAIIDQQS